MVTTRRVHLHALLNEGAAFDDDGERKTFDRFVLGTAGEGRAKCSCGEMSDVLSSSTKRKAWHRQHKTDVIERGHLKRILAAGAIAPLALGDIPFMKKPVAATAETSDPESETKP